MSTVETNVPRTEIPETNVPRTEIPETNVPRTEKPCSTIKKCSMQVLQLCTEGKIVPPTVNPYSTVKKRRPYAVKVRDLHVSTY